MKKQLTCSLDDFSNSFCKRSNWSLEVSRSAYKSEEITQQFRKNKRGIVKFAKNLFSIIYKLIELWPFGLLYLAS